MTGVIVGISPGVGHETVARIIERIEATFPGVRFLLVPGAASIAFEFDAEVES